MDKKKFEDVITGIALIGFVVCIFIFLAICLAAIANFLL